MIELIDYIKPLHCDIDSWWSLLKDPSSQVLPLLETKTRGALLPQDSLGLNKIGQALTGHPETFCFRNNRPDILHIKYCSYAANFRYLLTIKRDVGGEFIEAYYV